MDCPPLVLAVTLRQKGQRVGGVGDRRRHGQNRIVGVPPVQLTPEEVVCVFQLAKLTKKRFDTYVPVPGTDEAAPGACNVDWARLVELAAALRNRRECVGVTAPGLDRLEVDSRRRAPALEERRPIPLGLTQGSRMQGRIRLLRRPVSSRQRRPQTLGDRHRRCHDFEGGGGVASRCHTHSGSSSTPPADVTVPKTPLGLGRCRCVHVHRGGGDGGTRDHAGCSHRLTHTNIGVGRHGRRRTRRSWSSRSSPSCTWLAPSTWAGLVR